MFNSKAEFQINILSDGEKSCVVRFPSDSEWCERSRQRIIIRRILSTTKTQSETPNAEKVDAELFSRIRLDDGGQQFDAAEASEVIGRIETCQLVSSERQGNEFLISLLVPGGRVKHTLRMPSQRDIVDFGRAAVRVVNGRNYVEQRLRLEPSGDLWAKCAGTASGYADGSDVPIVHKDAAVVEMISLMRSATEEPDPEE